MSTTDAVAVIGMAGRFPGAPDIDTFWENLVAVRDTISRFDREELAAAGVRPDELDDPGYVPAKGVLDGADRFDAGLFGFSPREAEVLDPQQRVFLECVWHVLEDAGIDPRRSPLRIGVFGGAGMNAYLLRNLATNPAAVASLGPYQVLVSSDKDFLATRVSYKLGLTGPSLTVQTACSTSLTAVHLATQSLVNGECDVAVAGGVSVSAPLREGYLFRTGGILSPDGACRPFDAESAGTVAGNGVAAVVLRRLDDAVAAGDRVEAVIRGTAVNNDGADKVGYTAPSVDGQASVIAEALAVAGVAPAEIGYVETHGTGTPLGDPVEVAALGQVFGRDPERDEPCVLGAVKGNVGHLDAAAGVTGLIKAVLALSREQIPGTCHFTTPNPELNLAGTPFVVDARTRAWPRGPRPRRAGVSSFGIGGTNAHVVLEEAPPVAPRPPAPSRAWSLPLSAHSPAALGRLAADLADQLVVHPGTPLADVSATLATGRTELAHRAAVTARDTDEAVAALRAVAERPTATAVTAAAARRTVMLFPGQGSQYVDMARGLYDGEPVFRDVVDRCADALLDPLGADLREVVFAVSADGAYSADGAADAAARLTATRFAQPALFVIEYALVRWWESLGITPHAMIGHSVGELVAATVAGVFDVADALRLVAERGRLAQAMPPGTMLAVLAGEAEVRRRLDGDLALAAVNGPAACVVSGPTEAVERFRLRGEADGLLCRPLHTSHAFHSASMQEAADRFAEVVRGVRLHVPRIPFCSNVTGDWITDEQATDPAYWGRQLREGVRFGDGAALVLKDESVTLLEVGPGDVLRTFARQQPSWTPRHTAHGSLRHPKESAPDRDVLLRAVGALWSDGVAVDWQALSTDVERRAVRLPGYPFERERYWIEPGAAAPAPERATPANARRPHVADWFTQPGWRRLATEPAPTAAPTARPAAGGRWVFLGGPDPLVRALAERLSPDLPPVRVRRGPAFGRLPDGTWTLDPSSADDHDALWQALHAEGVPVDRVVQAWLLDAAPDEARESARSPHDGLHDGVAALVALARSLAGRAADGDRLLVDVLTRDAHDVLGVEPVRGEQAAVHGTAPVVGQELADVRCRTIDLTGDGTPRRPTLDALTRVLADPTTGPVIAVRGAHGWERTFDPVVRDGTGDLLVRDGGTYLVTGGLGGIGLAVAGWIAEHAHGVTLGLTGRAGLPPRDRWDDPATDQGPAGAAVAAVRLLEQAGARVLVLAADVTDGPAMQAAVGALRDAGGGRLDGVVHCAGVPSRGLLAGKTAQDVDEVTAAKTAGTLVLDAVCADDDLDFLLLFSSTTALLGGPGQSDYAAGNAYLAGHAARRRAEGAPVTAVLWDTWREVGMARGVTASLRGTRPGRPVAHPLIVEELPGTNGPDGSDGGTVFRSVLSTGEHWVLDDHRLLGHGLLPGTAYLELVRAALAERHPGRPIELTDVYFLAPVVVPDDRPVELFTTLEPVGERWRFTVRSREGNGWADHATGVVALLPEGATARPAAPEFAVVETIDTETEIKRRLRLDRIEEGEKLAFRFGPRWRSLRRIDLADHRLLVHLDLGAEFAADLVDYPLHPALLDAAGAAARVYVEDVYYLPLTYRSLRVLGPLTQQVSCDVVVHPDDGDGGETMTVDMDLLDDAGTVVVQVRGFSIKRINDVDGLVEQVARLTATGPATAASTASSASTGASAALSAADPAPLTGLALLSDGISAQEALAALDRLLRAPLPPPQVVVTARDVRSLIEVAAGLTPQAMAEEAGQLAGPVTTHPRPALATPFVEPADDLERVVAQVWSEVLGVSPVGVDDDFFALGGHSLAGIQIAGKLQTRLGVELDLKDFFAAPTVAGTAGSLRARLDGSTAAPQVIPRLDRDADGLIEVDDDLADLSELSEAEIEAELAALLAEDGGA